MKNIFVTGGKSYMCNVKNNTHSKSIGKIPAYTDTHTERNIEKGREEMMS